MGVLLVNVGMLWVSVGVLWVSVGVLVCVSISVLRTVTELLGGVISK